MKLITDYVCAALRRDPGAPAVVHRGQPTSYGELSSRSDTVARGLHARGVARGERIGVLTDKSIDAIVAIYAAFKLGCAYVPLNPALPAARLADAVALCSMRTVIANGDTDAHLVAALVAAGADVVDITLLEDDRRGVSFIPSRPAEDEPAAILTTSGSTGTPKGVVITHGNLGAFIAWAAGHFELTASDRLLSHAPLQFDLSFFDLFAAVAAGACTVLADAVDIASPGQLSTLVRQSGVTIWQSVPSAITLLAESGQRVAPPMPSVRCVLFAGERMPRKTVLALPRLFPNARAFNVYGATETNDTFIYELPRNPAEAADPLPIGRALPYVRYRVVDDDGDDVPLGEQGHLLVSAPTVMAGYVGAGAEAKRLGGPLVDYPTRDRVSVAADGIVHFHGRTDAVVKINGYRLNTLEIEDHIRALTDVDDACVAALADAQIGTRLVAFVRLADGARASTLDLKVQCAARLPRYAIPHSFHVVKGPFPKSPTGKIDKQKLAALLIAQQRPSPNHLPTRNVSHEPS